MDLEELRAFLAVARAGSFYGASKQTGIVRSTLARRIEALERRLGVPLIASDDHGVSLTEHGARMAAEGVQVLATAEAAEAAVLENSPEKRATFQGLLPEGAHSRAVARMAVQFGVLHPGISFDIRTLANPVEALADGGDFAVHWGDVPAGPWFKQLIRQVPFRLLANPTYLEQHGTPQALADLARVDLMLCRIHGQPEGRLPLLTGGSHGVSPRISSYNMQTLADLARNSDGIVWMPALQLPDEEWPTESIAIVLPEVVGADIPFWLVAPRKSARDPMILEIIQPVRDYLDAHRLPVG